jgi:hypothetical protein
MVLVCKRQFNGAGKTWPVGSVVPPRACGKNLQAMLDSRQVIWTSTRPPHPAKPRVLSKPVAQAPVPRALIVPDSDPVESFRLTAEAALRVHDGNQGKAWDALMAERDIRDLYRLACSMACAREAKLRGVASVSPNECGMVP